MEEPTESRPALPNLSPRTAVATAVVAGACYLALMVVLWAVLRSEAAEASPWVPFLGRFHFLLLHLPIGFLTVAIFLETAGWVVRPLRAAGAAINPILWLTFFGGVGATVFGLLLSRTGGYGEELLGDHQWSGIGLVIAVLLTLVAKLLFDHWRSRRAGLAYRGLLFLSAGLLVTTAHHGGSLTHGEDFLTKHTPPLLKKVLGEDLPDTPEIAPLRVEEMEVYGDVIAPVLEAKCWSCHNENKVKGDFRMDTFAFLMAGGETGNTSVVPGDPDGSELFYRLVTDDEDELMPPEGKDPLTPSEVQVVKWWIASGAGEHDTIGDLKPDNEIEPHLQAVLIPGTTTGVKAGGQNRPKGS